MHTMKNLREKNLNRITIYQVSLATRIVTCVCPLILYLPITNFIKNGFSVDTLMFFLLMLVGNIFVFYNTFNTYIRLDVKANKLVIREFLAAKRVIDLDDILQIEVSTDYVGKTYHKNFTIDIVYDSLARHSIYSWCQSYPYTLPLAFKSDERQVKRLQKFCDKCNQYLNSRQK